MTPKILHYTRNNNSSLADEGITHIELDSSVVEVPKGIFSGFRKLVEVTLHQEDDEEEESDANKSQLRIMASDAFWDCPHLRLVSFPIGLERIDGWAFGNCPKLQSPQLPDTLVEIGPFAFCGCNFRHFRVPPAMANLSNRMLEYCTKLYSIEVPESLMINTNNNTSFYGCERLRSLVFPNSIEDNSSQPPLRPWCHGCDDLLQVIADPTELSTALAHRFDGLPIHRLCYYQSYREEKRQVVALKEEWASQSPSHRQDFLGMTPLHILALSTLPNLEWMETMMALDPIQLVTPDFWGSLPIYYACECSGASLEMIRLLLQNHMAKYPDFQLDWTKLVTATGHMELAKLLLSEASSILTNVPDRLRTS